MEGPCATRRRSGGWAWRRARRAAPRPAGVREDRARAPRRRPSGATVIALSAADVFSEYVGEGERDAFARARRAAPAILLLDEIDGMVGNRGAAKDASSGGGADENTGNDVAARVLSAFLVEMDGLEVGGGDGDDGDDERRDGDGVLVVATTNRPNALDAALTRPGRLDLVLYVPPPDARGREAARACTRAACLLPRTWTCARSRLEPSGSPAPSSAA